MSPLLRAVLPSIGVCLILQGSIITAALLLQALFVPAGTWIQPLDRPSLRGGVGS